MRWRLVARLDGRLLRLPLAEGELEVGSAAHCDVRLQHFTVSRRHARLRVAPEGVELTDLGSSNGTRVDGRRIDGPVEIPPGRPLSFGSVEGELERVAEDELEPAVRVGGGSAPAGADDAPSAEPAEPDGREPATFSLGSLRELTARHLPELLARAAEGADARELAPALGAALHRGLPCWAVEVVGEGRAVLFRAGEVPAGAGAARRAAETPDGRLAVRVAFFAEPQAAGYGGLVEGAAHLLDLADRPNRRHRGSAPRRPRSPRPPAPPDPPSVVPRVRQIYADAARVARGDVSVLICGESGTGKEVLARYVHAASGRPAERFVALNCAALPPDLLEAELFGVEEGTATGVTARAGRFEQADGGTLFLDEIGDMAAATQAKILRALQEGEVYRLGGRSPRPARARVISATNRDVDELRAEGVMRGDLYHRIADWRVELPPLRQRRADVPNLAAHFLDREVRRRGLSEVGISRAAMDALAAYTWPGNIRQLEREMARVALFLEDGELVETGHLQESLGAEGRGAAGPPTLEEAVAETERREIERALERCGGDTRAAAGQLGIGRSTLYRKIDALGLER